MAKSRFVSYLRVSTARQGTSGLGLEAQRAAVAGFLNSGEWTLVEEVLEVEAESATTAPPSPPLSSSAANTKLPWSSPSWTASPATSTSSRTSWNLASSSWLSICPGESVRGAHPGRRC